MKWTYGNSWERFPIRDGEVWSTPDGSRVAAHDIFEPLPAFMRHADMVFVDPPWNQGNLTSFYTKAEIEGEYRQFDAFRDRLFECIDEINPRICYIEIGRQAVDEWYDLLSFRFPVVQRWQVTYYRRHPTFILRGGNCMAFADYTGMDEEDVIAAACRDEQYDCVADFCMGRGLVGLAASAAGRRFVGTELNPRRLAVLVDRLSRKGVRMQPEGVVCPAVTGPDINAFYSKDRQAKDRFAARVLSEVEHDVAVYLCPKAVAEHVSGLHSGCLVVPIEHFTRKDVFLHINSIVGENSTIIMENISRYTHLSSAKFNALHRLRMVTQHRYLIDIVPFTAEICKLYLPWSYLDREVLGYSHGWAFEYNYLEETADGRRVRAHDMEHLSGKLASHCTIDYPAFLPQPMHVVQSELTADEHAAYDRRKAELFAEYDSPGKIVTEICDCANMMPSRYRALADLLARLRGRVVVYTNIVKNNTLIKRWFKANRLPLDATLETYYRHRNVPIEADHVILFETPINNRYAILDVIADIPDGAETWYFRNDAKADRYIYKLMADELNAINRFTRTLWRTQNAASVSD